MTIHIESEMHTVYVICLRMTMRQSVTQNIMSESVEDSVTKDTASVAADAELLMSDMGVECTSEEIDTLSTIAERNSSMKAVSLVDVEREDLFNEAKNDTQVEANCSEIDTDMHI